MGLFNGNVPDHTQRLVEGAANDAAVRDALLQLWGGKVEAMGSKKAPGPLYGMASHRWSALAVAVTCAETVLKQETTNGKA
jgi:hypothetical protein